MIWILYIYMICRDVLSTQGWRWSCASPWPPGASWWSSAHAAAPPLRPAAGGPPEPSAGAAGKQSPALAHWEPSAMDSI